ncbi:hypothetical protein [Pseudomonas sp. A-RE-23]|uniref:hypothetical protein n=1 Tax=Pseudomonas sp. A-RE-23 TaxID=2832376 RepID=UPI001CBF3B02|nr:hypothetical protein [Pseudomonas sp. A-RE-23]
MFDKYPNQAIDRRVALWSGFGFMVVGMLFFVFGGGAVSLVFFLPGFILASAAIFCNYERFDTAKRIGKFFECFS